MSALLNALYLGGSVVMLVLLFLPTVFLLAASAACVLYEAIRLLWRRRTAA